MKRLILLLVVPLVSCERSSSDQVIAPERAVPAVASLDQVAVEAVDALRSGQFLCRARRLQLTHREVETLDLALELQSGKVKIAVVRTDGRVVAQSVTFRDRLRGRTTAVETEDLPMPETGEWASPILEQATLAACSGP